MTQRQVKEGRLRQGVDERIAYNLTTTPWCSSPGTITVKLYDVTTGAKTDVSSTMLAGTASATGDVISTPLVTGLTAGSLYRMEIKFVSVGNTFEAYAEIQGEE